MTWSKKGHEDYFLELERDKSADSEVNKIQARHSRFKRRISEFKDELDAMGFTEAAIDEIRGLITDEESLASLERKAKILKKNNEENQRLLDMVRQFPVGWLEEQRINKAREGDREAALEILAEVAGEIRNSLAVRPGYKYKPYFHYVADALQSVVEGKATADEALNLGNPAHRPEDVRWVSHPLLTIRPRLMTTEEEEVQIAEAVAWARRRHDRKGDASKEVAEALGKSKKTVENLYYKHRGIAEALCDAQLRKPNPLDE